MGNILIIGGGISGLVSAYSELKKGNRVTLREEKDRLGGMIHTLTTPHGLVETAANGMLNSAKVEQLIEDLGLNITHHNKASKRRYFYIDGKLRRLPFSLKSGIRGFMGFFFKNAKPLDEETMEEWSNRIFGEEITYNLIEPALGGIYSTPLSKMSPEMVFSNFSLQEDRSFFKAIKSRKKLKKPKIRGLVSFQNGMQELVDKLKNYLEQDPNCTIELNTNAINLGKIRSEKIYDQVVICLPIQSSYKLCHSDTASKVFLEKYDIQEPNYHSIATLTRFSEESIFSKPAFGVLFPKNSRIKANGVLSNDSIFPGRTLKKGIFSETWIYSGDWLKETNEGTLQSILEEDRTLITKTNQNKNSIAVYTKKWIDSFPVYDENLLKFNTCLDEIEEYHSKNHKPIRFLGNYRRGIGLRSLIENAMND
jgi:protoporphyrinogen/coproporphyrinogen III oxidase